MTDLLIEAVSHNNVALTKRLIEEGICDVNDVDRYGRTALTKASMQGYVDCAKVLLEEKANVDQCDGSRWTPLHNAAHNGYLKFVQLLLKWNANLNSRTRHGQSALHWAADRGHIDCIRVLIESGADIEAETTNGKTPILSALFYHKYSAAELLFDKGAKTNTLLFNFYVSDEWNAIIAKRKNVKSAYLVFYGVLRRRLRIGKDMTKELSKHLWATRFQEEWVSL